MISNSTYIIAEIGVNHNGSIILAKKMINLAKKCGANAVKFQNFKAENLVTFKTKKARYQISNTKNKSESMYSMLKKLELNDSDFIKLIKYSKKKKIDFISTPYDLESLIFLQSQKINIIKIASTDVTNLPYLKKIDQLGINIILSTGMSSMNEVKKAVSCLNKTHKNKKLTILQCTSDYPAKIHEANLRVIQTYSNTFNCKVGYSDHTNGNFSANLAVALGASVIEKHFTLDKNLEGPDHLASLEPSEFKKFCDDIRFTEKILGNGNKTISSREIGIKKNMQKSLVLKKNYLKGEILNFDDVVFKRPGIGIQPKDIKLYKNRKLNRNIKADTIVFDKDFE